MFLKFNLNLINCIICVLAPFVWAERLGDVHTSVAQISKLVELEARIVLNLEKYLKREENRLKVIKSYTEDWKTINTDAITTNPLAGYHFLVRIWKEFKTVEHHLSDANSDKVKTVISKAKSQYNVPIESDVNGAAWALVRLQDVYNISMEDFVDGKILWAQPAKRLTATDCLRFGEQSFKNLEFDLSDKWTEKGIELLESKATVSAGEEIKIKRARNALAKRKILRNFVTEIVQKSSQEVVNRFSGLGIPTSFQKTIHFEEEANEQLSEVEDTYRRLCRGEIIQKNMNTKYHMGDRISTVLFYLTDVEAGGATVFPTLKIRVPAEKNSALVWFNLKRNGKGDYRTLHASCPVLLGQKWIANLWLHEYGQEFRWPCLLDSEV